MSYFGKLKLEMLCLLRKKCNTKNVFALFVTSSDGGARDSEGKRPLHFAAHGKGSHARDVIDVLIATAASDIGELYNWPAIHGNIHRFLSPSPVFPSAGGGGLLPKNLGGEGPPTPWKELLRFAYTFVA